MEEKIWEKIIHDLTEEQVTSILTDLGSAPPKRDSENNLLFQSLCHNSSSWKLCYYTATHSFFCYKDWESFNIFNLVMRVKDCDFSAALNYVCKKLNIDFSNSKVIKGGFGSNYAKEDWDIFDKFERIQERTEQKQEKIEEPINPKILDLYSELYYEGWMKEHISIRAMQKYNIRYDTVNNRIIIPHYDENSNLIGIRCRNLNPITEIKYCPISVEGKLYNHSLSSHLYGLHKNKETIKKISKAMIVESEKAVLQSESYFPENSFTVACCGSNISYEQIQLLISLGVTEIILAMDWDFEKQQDDDEKYCLYKIKTMKLCQKLIPYFTVKVLLPPDEHFLYKCSPTDLGKEYLLQSMKKKVQVTYDTICEEKELQNEKKGDNIAE